MCTLRKLFTSALGCCTLHAYHFLFGGACYTYSTCTASMRDVIVKTEWDCHLHLVGAQVRVAVVHCTTIVFRHKWLSLQFACCPYTQYGSKAQAQVFLLLAVCNVCSSPRLMSILIVIVKIVIWRWAPRCNHGRSDCFCHFWFDPPRGATAVHTSLGTKYWSKRWEDSMLHCNLVPAVTWCGVTSSQQVVTPSPLTCLWLPTTFVFVV